MATDIELLEYRRAPSEGVVGQITLENPLLEVVGEYTHAYYRVPNDILNVWRVKLEKQIEPVAPSNWRLEGEYLRVEYPSTDSAGVYGKIYIDYTRRVTNLNTWSTKALDAFRIRLAAEMAITLVESGTMHSTLLNEYQVRLDEASRKDGAQAKPEITRSTRLTGARSRGTLS